MVARQQDNSKDVVREAALHTSLEKKKLRIKTLISLRSFIVR
jgi:hypothetical protein